MTETDVRKFGQCHPKHKFSLNLKQESGSDKENFVIRWTGKGQMSKSSMSPEVDWAFSGALRQKSLRSSQNVPPSACYPSTSLF